MKLTQRQTVELIDKLLNNLEDSTHRVNAHEMIDDVREDLVLLKSLMRGGDGFYDNILHMSERSMVEVTIETKHKVE